MSFNYFISEQVFQYLADAVDLADQAMGRWRTEGERLRAHLRELVGRVVALQRQVLPRRSQVLSDRQDVAVDVAKVADKFASRDGVSELL